MGGNVRQLIKSPAVIFGFMIFHEGEAKNASLSGTAQSPWL